MPILARVPRSGWDRSRASCSASEAFSTSAVIAEYKFSTFENGLQAQALAATQGEFSKTQPSALTKPSRSKAFNSAICIYPGHASVRNNLSPIMNPDGTLDATHTPASTVIGSCYGRKTRL